MLIPNPEGQPLLHPSTHADEDGILRDAILEPRYLTDKVTWHQAAEAVVWATNTETEDLSAIFLDMDSFKGVNDGLGHDTGDKVLEAMEDIITNVGFDGIAGRLGGDEFGLLCKIDRQTALDRTTQIRTLFDKWLDKPENSAIRDTGVGISIGIGVLEPGMSAAELLRAADEAMYEDKLSRIELSDLQRRAVEFARFVLESQKVRLRDLPKIIQAIDGKKL